MSDDQNCYYPMANSVTVYDYIDSDGDLIALDVVDTEWLALSILRRGRTQILTVLMNESSDARKMAAHLNAWADIKDGIA